MDYTDYAEWLPIRLATLRTQKNISARELSLLLGQCESYINKIENGRTLPSMQGFFAICDYLQVTPQEFFAKEVISPTKNREIMDALGKLSPQKTDHVLQIIKDMIH